jgi:acyl-CoA synthetase (AMP-forming)/AMP-acid ligase II
MNKSGLFTIKDVLFDGNQDPNHNAIECPGYEPLIYHDLRLQILYVVKTLNAMGFHRNDRIAVITPAGPETAVIIISVMTGFTVIPLNPQCREQEYTDIFSQLRIKAIIVQKDQPNAAMRLAMIQNIPVIELRPVSKKAGKFGLGPAMPPDGGEAEFAISSDIAYVFLTSGTTATSKIVPVSQKQSVISKQRTCIAARITAADRSLHIIPYYHTMGIGSSLLTPLIAGGTVICTRDFIPSDFTHLLRKYRPTWFMAGPALHAGILREIKKSPPSELNNHSLRYIRSGSGFLPVHVRQELEELLKVPVIDAYAMSEAGAVAINIPPKRGSVGIPFIDSIQIIDQNGLSLKPNMTGEILIKGETVFNGYENAPDENNAAFIDGWFRTGDMGYLDDEGYLFLTGRKKEQINKGGEKLSPVEIDTVLMSHPLVREAMVFPVQDPVLGEDIGAMIVREQENLTANDLRIYLLDRLTPSKIPRRFYFVDAIPKNANGKPLRYVGTDRYGGLGFQGY